MKRQKMSEQQKKINQIRRRKSYQQFLDIIVYLTDKPTIEDVLKLIYSIKDENHLFRSKINSEYAYEALQQILEDLKSGYFMR